MEPRIRYRLLSPSQKDWIVRLYTIEHLNIEAIVDRTGIGRRSVRRALHDNGVEMRIAVYKERTWDKRLVVPAILSKVNSQIFLFGFDDKNILKFKNRYGAGRVQTGGFNG